MGYPPLLALVAAVACVPATSFAQRLRVPAQWEPHDRVWLTWFGQGRRDSVSPAMVKALQPHVKLTINVASEVMKANARTFLAAEHIDLDRIDFAVDPSVDYCVRDYAVFVKDDVDKVHIVDFVYTIYGQSLPMANPPMPEVEKKFGQWAERLAAQQSLPLITSDLALEAGGIDTNGDGTFLIIRQMVLQHIRFGETNKSPVDSINYPMLEANARILQAARTASRANHATGWKAVSSGLSSSVPPVSDYCTTCGTLSPSILERIPWTPRPSRTN